MQLTTIASHKNICELNPENLPDFLANESLPLPKGSGGSDSSDGEGVGDVPVMSLKMRLFKGKKRKELCSMFDNNHLSKTICIDVTSGSESDKENDVSISGV